MKRLTATLAFIVALCGYATAQVGLPFPGPGGAIAVPSVFTHVQGILGPDGSATTATTLVQALPSTVTSGNAVFGILAWDDTGGITLTSIVDDKGNTYNLGTLVNATTDGVFSRTFWRGNITNAPQTLTATFSATIGFRRILIDEYSGVTASTNPSDGNTGVRQASTTAASSGNITTTVNSDLIYGALYNAAASGTTTAGSGFTIREGGTQTNQIPLFSEDSTQTTAGAIAATFTLSVAGEVGTSIVAAKH